MSRQKATPAEVSTADRVTKEAQLGNYGKSGTSFPTAPAWMSSAMSAPAFMPYTMEGGMGARIDKAAYRDLLRREASLKGLPATLPRVYGMTRAEWDKDGKL